MWICLIRLTLWADGLAHDSLSAQEMLFLTVAYDWMLFGYGIGIESESKLTSSCTATDSNTE